MAIDLCADNSGGISIMSPRYSFSHDAKQSDNLFQIEHKKHPSFDFDFTCIDPHSSSSADELFSDGMIRSVQIKENNNVPKSNSTEQMIPNVATPVPAETIGATEDLKPQPSSKSFWGFKRSSSLNCGSGYGRGLCPLPPLLSRSHSTGSASAPPKKNQKPNHSQKNSTSSNYMKPPLKKSGYGSYGNSSNGVHVNPVLHVPSVGLFGFGSIFSNGKVKNKNR